MTEFFADFGTFDVNITLPKNYVIGATGVQVSDADNGNGTNTVAFHAEDVCLLYTSPSPRDRQKSRMPSSA